MAAIVAGDIHFKLSIVTGTAGNQSAQPDPNASRGKYISTTALSGTALHNLFDAVSGAENTAGLTDYRCVFVHNANASNTYENVVVYMSGGDPAGGSTVALGVDTTAASALGSASAQALEIANDTTAPAGVSFATTPVSIATGLSLGNIPAGQVKAFWVRRVTSGAAAVNGETITLAVTGDTGAL